MVQIDVTEAGIRRGCWVRQKPFHERFYVIDVWAAGAGRDFEAVWVVTDPADEGEDPKIFDMKQLVLVDDSEAVIASEDFGHVGDIHNGMDDMPDDQALMRRASILARCADRAPSDWMGDG